MAVDISEGRVVRLVKGDPAASTVYSEDPVKTALDWAQRGAEWLHVVDLDAAFSGEARNAKIVEEIIRAVDVSVQVSGGVRSLNAIEGWLDRGARRVCVGTSMVDPKFATEAAKRFGGSLVAAVDSASGEVRVEGWTSGGGITAPVAAKRLADCGVQRLLFTDIDRDGTLTGLNVASIEELLEAVDLPVIAGGGIRDADSIRSAAALVPKGLEGLIVGTALYSGSVDLEEAKIAGSLR